VLHQRGVVKVCRLALDDVRERGGRRRRLAVFLSKLL